MHMLILKNILILKKNSLSLCVYYIMMYCAECNIRGALNIYNSSSKYKLGKGYFLSGQHYIF